MPQEISRQIITLDVCSSSPSQPSPVPAGKRRSQNIGSTVGQRRRRRPGVEPMVLPSVCLSSPCRRLWADRYPTWMCKISLDAYHPDTHHKTCPGNLPLPRLAVFPRATCLDAVSTVVFAAPQTQLVWIAL